ncbi:MAG TPA: hypothetical protein VMZ26_01620 [Pyrinomonadaceae bacterium]|nr:hypothetical protein [Pyrinomonadaceae bacterium]
MKKINLHSVICMVAAAAAIGFFSTTGYSQTITVNVPGATPLTALTRITGSQSGVARIRLSIGKAESDEVWNCSTKSGVKQCSWRTGPTGQWMNAVIRGGTWAASPSTLPTGRNLPDGRYVIHIYGEDASGGTVVQQFTHPFSIAR